MVSGDAIKEYIRLIECPRDAMQGWRHFIPTEKKVAFLNQLLKVGFDTLDFGSFVSHKAIPQMADTKEVLGALELHEKKKPVTGHCRQYKRGGGSIGLSAD